MDPLLSGALIALVSAAAGLLGNYIAQRSADKRRWEREDKVQQRQWELEQEAQRERWRREDLVRHHPERFQLYTEFNQAASAIVASSWAYVLDEMPVYAKEESQELYRKVVAELYPRIQVVASEPVKEAAQKFVSVITNAAFFGATGDLVDDQAYAQALGNWSQRFAEAAREELGLVIDPKDTESQDQVDR